MLAAETIQTAFAADHDRLEELFASFRKHKRVEMARARKFFKEFKIGLQRHIVLEESILFPLFEKKTGIYRNGPTDVMRAEHRRIGQYLEAIHDKVRKLDPDSDGEEQELMAELASHNEKEERVLYPTLDRLLSDSERIAAFTAIEQVPAEAYQHCCGHHG